MSEPLSMTVTFDRLTAAQAIALKAYFEHWQMLGSIGASRWTSFYADGDGNFRPKVACQFSADPFPAQMTDDERKALMQSGFEREHAIDFDAIAWRLHLGPRP